jgi:hypothetical protein
VKRCVAPFSRPKRNGCIWRRPSESSLYIRTAPELIWWTYSASSPRRKPPSLYRTCSCYIKFDHQRERLSVRQGNRGLLCSFRPTSSNCL